MTSNESGVLLQDVLDMTLEAERKLGPNCRIHLCGCHIPPGPDPSGQAGLRLDIRVNYSGERTLSYSVESLPGDLQHGVAATELLQLRLDDAVREIQETLKP